jgi:Copper type II ascorbate-dependent monooxygenase, C-terminal domain
MKYQVRFAILFSAAACAFAATTDVTFHKDVEPILQKHCQECHRPGEIAPFSLLSYSDARPWAKAIRADLLTKKMPPWFADPQVGHFSNDRSLTAEEVSKVVSWVDGGAKEGNAKDAPKALAFVDGWNIQKPDVVLSMKESFHLPAKGDIPYQYVVLPTQFTEDKWVQMAEARPSDRSVVHHVVIFIRDPESKWLREAKTNVPFVPSGGDFQNISGGGNDILMIYTPGKVPEIWRPGLGKMIKAGSDLVLQIHYTTSGKETEDHTQVGLVFAKEKPTDRAMTIGGYNLGFKIPPQDPDYKVVAKNTFPNGATILNFFPHMHLRGKSFEYTVVYPDGHSELLLRVPKYDFFWQLDYQLTKPLTIPPGSQIICTASYDNSPNNLKNPDPTATVRFGEQSWEEMMIGFYDVQIPADMSVRDFFTPKKTEGATTGSSDQ